MPAPGFGQTRREVVKMWQLVTLTDDDKPRFDAYVANAEHGDFLQSCAWGELKAASGWKPLRVALVDEEGQWGGAASILERRLPLVRQTMWYAPRGPVLDFRNSELLGAFFQGLRTIAAHRKMPLFFKMDPDVEHSAELEPLFRQHGLRPSRRRGKFDGLQPRHVCRIPIDMGEEELFQGFSSKCRYNIRLAERRGVTVREATRAELPIFYALLQETSTRDGFMVRDLSYFEAMWRHTVDVDYGRVFLAIYDGQPIAGTWVIAFGWKAWYLYGASSNRARQVMPNHALQWHAMRWARGRGARLYDFLGVPPKSKVDSPIYGLYRFKHGFGADVTSFIGEWDLPFRRNWYVLWRLGEPLVAKGMVLFSRARRRLRSRTSTGQDTALQK